MLGTVISHYKLLDTLGAGGMGVVYRAEDTRLGRQVALKCLPAEVAADPQMVERFLREARSASVLNHPNICTIHEVDQDNGQHFITMELLEGQTLRDRIADGPIAMDDIVRIGTEIADALDAAHKKGIVHRDIKPANVFLTNRGESKVLDFGLAKQETPKLAAGASGMTAATGMADLHLTSPGQTVGTIAYMSPEQAKGQDVDARSDLFSFGVVLYEMVSGATPFSGPTSALIFDAILNRTPAPLARHNPAVPPALDSIVAKLLEKDRRLRYQSASDLVADLRRLQRDAGSAKSAAVVAVKPRKAGKIIDSLAVLPFTNATGDSELDYIGDAIAEAVIDALSHLPRLRVVPRSKAFRYRDQADNPHDVARELEVRAILSGRVSSRGQQLSIRAELIDIAKDAQLWGAQFSRTATDATEVDQEIARRVIEKLVGPSSGGSKTPKPGRKPAAAPPNKEAYQLYLRGTHYANKWTPEGLQRGMELFREALDVDPMCAPAYASLAVAFCVMTVVGRVDAVNAHRQAKACARRALELDDSLSEAHAALGFALLFSDFNLADAAREAQRSVELNPASGIARYSLGQTLSVCGRLDEAIEASKKGCELDPLMAPINYIYGLVLYYDRQYAEAETQLRRTIEINPSFMMAHAVLGIVIARQGRFEEAMDQVTRFLQASPDFVWDLLLAYVAALAGKREKAEGILARSQAASPGAGAYFAATIYGVFGELDKGFACLEQARDLRFGVLTSAAVNPALDNYHSDPRWIPFLQSLNLGIDVTRIRQVTRALR